MVPEFTEEHGDKILPPRDHDTAHRGNLTCPEAQSSQCWPGDWSQEPSPQPGLLPQASSLGRAGLTRELSQWSTLLQDTQALATQTHSPSGNIQCASGSHFLLPLGFQAVKDSHGGGWEARAWPIPEVPSLATVIGSVPAPSQQTQVRLLGGNTRNNDMSLELLGDPTWGLGTRMSGGRQR